MATHRIPNSAKMETFTDPSTAFAFADRMKGENYRVAERTKKIGGVRIYKIYFWSV